MSVGERIKQARTEKALSQFDLGLQIGMSQGAIWQYENSDVLPALSNVVPLAQALDVTTDWLLGLDSRLLPELKIAVVKSRELAFLQQVTTALNLGALSERQVGLLSSLVAEFVAPLTPCRGT